VGITTPGRFRPPRSTPATARRDAPALHAEADPVALASRVAAQRQAVFVLEEGARLPAVELDRLLGVPREFEQAATAPLLRPRDRAGAEQIAGRHRAAAARVVASCCAEESSHVRADDDGVNPTSSAMSWESGPRCAQVGRSGRSRGGVEVRNGSSDHLGGLGDRDHALRSRRTPVRGRTAWPARSGGSVSSGTFTCPQSRTTSLFETTSDEARPL
jgi:hypothetical protein